jgi:hypothetical protein
MPMMIMMTISSTRVKPDCLIVVPLQGSWVWLMETSEVREIVPRMRISKPQKLYRRRPELTQEPAG